MLFFEFFLGVFEEGRLFGGGDVCDGMEWNGMIFGGLDIQVNKVVLE